MLDIEAEYEKFKKETSAGTETSDKESSPDSDDSSEEDEARKLQRLRQEMEVLNGDDEETLENETDETKRSMKLMLKSGIIPDASLIHAARKKREMARQEGDFIPINSAASKSKSRMIRYKS